jgi:hypothetical protein
MSSGKFVPAAPGASFLKGRPVGVVSEAAEQR